MSRDTATDAAPDDGQVGDEVKTDARVEKRSNIDDEINHSLGPRVESTRASGPLQLPASSDNTENSNDMDPSDLTEPPEGGMRAWAQVLSAHLVSAMTWGYGASFGVYQLYYTDTLGLPSSQVSWIGSVQVFLTLAVCAPSGRLADAGYPRETVLVGSLLVVVGTLTTSFATAYWQILLAQGICTGLGLGLAFMPTVSVVSSYFCRNRPMALSIVAVGTSVGSIVFPATVHYLKPRIGFPWAVRCAALIALIFCAVSCVLLKPRLRPRRAGPWVEWRAFRELPYLLFALGAFLNFYVLYVGFFYINSYARNVIGFSSLDSINILLITNALGIPTRPLIGYIANAHLGPINVFTLSMIGSAIIFYGWTGVSTRSGMFAYSVVYGIIVSVNQGTFFAALASLTKDPRKMGTRFGMVETLGSFAALAGPPTAGAIIDRTGGYLGTQLWGGGVLTVAAVIFVALRVSVTGWTWRAKV